MAGRSREVVLIEDNSDDERLVQMALGKSGIEHSLVVLRDGEEAWNWFAARVPAGSQRSEHPGVVLLDHRVPKLSGLELLERLRSEPRFDTIPVVIVSSGAELRDLSEYYRAGANSVIGKSTDWAESMIKLPAVVSYWLDVNKTGI